MARTKAKKRPNQKKARTKLPVAGAPVAPQNYWVHYLVMAVIFGFYLYFGLSAPQTEESKRLITSTAQLGAVQYSFYIPYLFMLAAITYGWIKTHEYADFVKGSPEGPGFRDISFGLGVLAYGFALQALSSSIASYVALSNRYLYDSLTILNRYIDLIYPLLAFYLIMLGAKHLLSLYRPVSQQRLPSVWLIFVGVMMVFYVYLFFLNPTRTNTYGLNDLGILASIILPSILSWVIGTFAVSYMRQYMKAVPGTIYRQGLSRLSSGLASIIIVLIAVGLLQSLGAQIIKPSPGPADFAFIFGNIYVLLLIYALGFIYIALGAKKLSQLERVV